MKKVFFLMVFVCLFFFVAKEQARADWVECPIRVTDPGDGVLSGTGSDQMLSSATHEYVGVKTNCVPDSNGIKIQFQTSAPAIIYFQNAYGSFKDYSFSGTGVDSYIDTNPNDILSLAPAAPAGLIFGDRGVVPATFSHFQMFYWVPSPSPTPSPLASSSPSPSATPAPTPTPAVQPTATISVVPSTTSPVVGMPFTADVEIRGGGQAVNAAQASITVSSNLSVIGLQTPATNACNLQYTQAPSISNPSFAGAIAHGSSMDCKVMTLVLSPKSVGTGIVSFSNVSVKSFANSQEIFSSANNGLFSIANQNTQTANFVPKNFSFDAYPFDIYGTTIGFSGQKDSAITHVLLNDSESGLTYPTTSSWQVTSPGLSLGDNTFSFYGKDDAGNKTAVQNITVNRHMLGDIDGDGVVDIKDISLFAVDWGKKGSLTYSLSDLNGDGVVDLTDLSLLAKQEVAL